MLVISLTYSLLHPPSGTYGSFATLNNQLEAQLLKALESLDEKKPRNLVMVMQNGQLHQHTKRQVRFV